MAKAHVIDLATARAKVRAGGLLVCAYEDEAKCRQLNLDGAMSLRAFQARVPTLAKDQDIVFYCA